MSLQVSNFLNKQFLFKAVKENNYFFIFEINDSFSNSFLHNYFVGKVLHINQVPSLVNDVNVLKIFSGNLYICFVEYIHFFDVLIDLYFFNLSKFNLSLVGLCYDNFFLNLNLSCFNMLNVFVLNIYIVFFLVLLYVNLFFFKFFLLIKKIILLKKC